MARQTQLDQSPLHLLHRVCQCAAELFHAQMAGIDLTPRQFVVLVAVAQRDGSSQQDITARTGIDRSTVSQMVQAMARKGLLKRRRARTDARAYVVTLTPAGHDILKASEPVVGRIDAALIAALPELQASAFVDSLRSIIDSFKSRRATGGAGLQKVPEAAKS